MIKSKIVSKDRKDDILSRVILKKAIEGLYLNGVITDEDLTDRNKLIKKIKGELISSKKGISIVIDHTRTLLRIARDYYKKEEYDLSYLFYAIYFEHEVNDIIDIYCSRNKIEQKVKNEIIKSTNISAKYSWLLTILKFPNFNDIHRKTILDVSDKRNAYIHYKWNEDQDTKLINNSEKEKLKRDIELNKIELAIRYLTNYKLKNLFNNKKKTNQ